MLSFSLPFKGKGGNSKKSALAESRDSDDQMEDDPVVALFRSRTTQRVRFSLETEQTQQPKYEKVDVEKEPSASSGAHSNSAGSLSIKKFMKGALFGRKSKDSFEGLEFDEVVAKEIESAKENDPEMVWESAHAAAGAEEIVRTKANGNADGRGGSSESLTVSFTESKETRAQVIKLLNKACRAQFVHFRYELAVKYCMKALELLKKAKYPDDHPTVVKTLQSLNSAHHALSSYQNSANIVKMGIKYEDAGELVRALKMYTIAYRIRRDNLSSNHPSLLVLLNMLGSIQVKRDELEEAMEIYELALKDDPVMNDGEDYEMVEETRTHTNILAKSVAFREMGTIYERWGEVDEALKMYHRSLDCVAEYKGISLKPEKDSPKTSPTKPLASSSTNQNNSPISVTDEDILLDLESVHLSRSFAKHTAVVKANNNEDDGYESGGMELFIGSRPGGSKGRSTGIVTSSCYDAFFPHSLDDVMNRAEKSSVAKALDDNSNKDSKGAKGDPDQRRGTDYADVDIALTLHQIGQLHRAEGEFNLALAAYMVALRGMKNALGKNHPNVAAILGNIGNLQKEMGDMTAAFETYQQVLAIESYRLGLTHPDVAITLHNIATIDAARGNHEHALDLYMQVTELQRKLFGNDHMSLAVTAACMGDVFEKIGSIAKAIECFEEALRIKTSAMGRHSLEVARVLHKLGKLSVLNGDYHLADSYLSRTILIYRLNKLPEDDEWVVDANRDVADIDAVIAMGRGAVFEC